VGEEEIAIRIKGFSKNTYLNMYLITSFSFNKYKREIFAALIIVVLFVVAGYFSQVYLASLTDLLGEYGVLGMLVYVLGATIATIIAPLSFLPILPVAVALWGSFTAAVLSIGAWSVGAAVAFLLARRYGRPLVSHFVGEQKMNYISGILPDKHLFIAVVFLRIAVPVDLLSYALGLFAVMRFWPYMLATVIGITPFAFVFSYLADFNIWFQIGALVIGAVIIAISFPYMKKRYVQMFIEDSQSEISG